jgi:hypothetical protein
MTLKERRAGAEARRVRLDAEVRGLNSNRKGDEDKKLVSCEFSFICSFNSRSYFDLFVPAFSFLPSFICACLASFPPRLPSSLPYCHSSTPFVRSFFPFLPGLVRLPCKFLIFFLRSSLLLFNPTDLARPSIPPHPR